jgi:hypothetical protein
VHEINDNLMLILKCIPYESDTMRLKKYFKWLARVNTYLSAWVESVIQVVNLGCLQSLINVKIEIVFVTNQREN